MDEPASLHFSETVFSVFINFCLLCSLLLSHNLLLVEYEVIYYQPESNFENYNVQVDLTLGTN